MPKLRRSSKSKASLTLDLNNPDHARVYVRELIYRGVIGGGSEEALKQLYYGTDQEYLIVAHQLFMECDARPVFGTRKNPY